MAVQWCGWNIVDGLVDTSGKAIPAGTRCAAWFYSDGAPGQALPISAQMDPNVAGRLSLRFPSSALKDGTATGRFELWFEGYKLIGADPAKQLRCDIPPIGNTDGHQVTDDPKSHPGLDPYPLPPLEPSEVPFPSDVQLEAIAPPWDTSIPGEGDVHTDPATGIPNKRDLMFIRADFAGVTIPGNYSPPDSASIIANGGCTITDGEYAGLFIPFVNGANTTPPTMLMSPQLILYPEPVKQAYFKEYTKRNYTHFIWSPIPWENDPLPDDVVVAWGKRIKSMFYSIIWQSTPSIGDPYCQMLRDAGVVDWIQVGKEVDGKFTAQEYEQILDWFVANFPGIQLAAHFNANYPKGFPKDTFFDGSSMKGWDAYNGRVHLFWQADQRNSAAMKGAMLYYARLRVNVGGIGGNNQPSPDCRVYAYEIKATDELYGATELVGCLQGTEMMQCPNNPGDGVRPFPDGFGNGARDPDGHVYGWRTWQ